MASWPLLLVIPPLTRSPCCKRGRRIMLNIIGLGTNTFFFLGWFPEGSIENRQLRWSWSRFQAVQAATRCPKITNKWVHPFDWNMLCVCCGEFQVNYSTSSRAIGLYCVSRAFPFRQLGWWSLSTNNQIPLLSQPSQRRRSFVQQVCVQQLSTLPGQVATIIWVKHGKTIINHPLGNNY
jgi:hypothetical protein